MSNLTKLFAIGLAAATLFAGEVQHISASVVLNGSFEDTTNFVATPPTSDDTMVLLVGNNTAMPGWKVVGNSSIAWIGPGNPFLLTASNGRYFLDLTGYEDNSPNFGGVSQSIPTTPGTTYVLSFDLGSSTTYNPSGTAAITATAGSTTGIFSFTTSSTNAWFTESMSFTATANNTLITLQGSTGVQYIGLDNVSVDAVAAVPEPTSRVVWLLLGLGSVSVFWRRCLAV